MPRKNDTNIGAAPDRGLPGILDTTWKNKFPAHVFKRSGGLDSNTDKQRIILSMGVLPSADYFDRYMYDEENDELFLEGVYHDYVDDSVEGYYNLVDRDTKLFIYKSTGRVKVAADDE